MMRVFGYLDPVAKSGTSSIGVTESVTMEKSSVDALITRNAALESEVKQLRLGCPSGLGTGSVRTGSVHLGT
jgi:hypothetical protein